MRENETPELDELRACPSSASKSVADTMMRHVDLASKRSRILRDVHGVLLERVQRNDLKRPRVGGRQHYVGGGAIFVGPQPVERRYAPAVAGCQPREVVQRDRRDQVVADATLVLEERGRDHRTDCVAPPVLRAGPTAPVTEKAGDWVNATRLKLATEHITISHCASMAREASRGPLPRLSRSSYCASYPVGSPRARNAG